MLGHKKETLEIEHWISRIADAAAKDTNLAVEIAECGRLVKGYGETRERYNQKFREIIAIAERLPPSEAAREINRARNFALSDIAAAAF